VLLIIIFIIHCHKGYTLSFTFSLLWVSEVSPCLAIFILPIDVQTDILKACSTRLKKQVFRYVLDSRLLLRY